MHKTFIMLAALLGAIAVGLGAFGAHALKARLEAINRLDTFETAVKYQFWHVLALLFIGLAWERLPGKMLAWSGYSMVAGIIIFSGSLYILCLTNVPKWGAVTPIGGLALIAGWVLLLLACVRS